MRASYSCASLAAAEQLGALMHHPTASMVDSCLSPQLHCMLPGSDSIAAQDQHEELASIAYSESAGVTIVAEQDLREARPVHNAWHDSHNVRQQLRGPHAIFSSLTSPPGPMFTSDLNENVAAHCPLSMLHYAGATALCAAGSSTASCLETLDRHSNVVNQSSVQADEHQAWHVIFTA